MNDGLKDKHRQAIIDILAAHRDVERAVLFGSRAMGTFTATSDVDIALFGDGLSLDDQAILAREIDQLPMPQRVDLLRYRTIKDKKLLAHIRKHGVEWLIRGEPQKKLSGDAERRLGKSNEQRVRCLGDVAVVVMGLSPKGETYNHAGHGTPLLNGPTEFGQKHPQATLFTTAPARFAEPGDILFCVRGSTTGRMNWADKQYAIGRGIASIRAKTNNKDTYFICCCICDALQRLLSLASGSVFPNLSTGDIKSFEIPWPEKDIRERIAYILGTLDDKIELNRRMNRTLEQMAAAIFKSWFIDFDPVHAKAEGQDTGLPKEIADLFPDSFEDSELGEIPKGWTPGALADIANNPRRSIKPEEVPSATPYIGLQDMPRRCIALDSWGRADEVGSQKSRFSAGEILFGKLRPYFHKVGIAPVSGICSTDILVIVVKENAWHSYVLSLVSSKAFVDYTDTHSGGTKMPRTNWKDMGRYPLALPPIELAQAFQDYMAPLHQRIGVSVRQNRRLARLRDTLLPKLLSGELELPAIEAVEEGAA